MCYNTGSALAMLTSETHEDVAMKSRTCILVKERLNCGILRLFRFGRTGYFPGTVTGKDDLRGCLGNERAPVAKIK